MYRGGFEVILKGSSKAVNVKLKAVQFFTGHYSGGRKHDRGAYR